MTSDSNLETQYSISVVNIESLLPPQKKKNQ